MNQTLVADTIGAPIPLCLPSRDWHSLTWPAHVRLCAKLENEFGNKLTPDHKAALLSILEQFTAIASGKETGRWAFGLGCGLGKSLAVVCWCAQMIAARRRYSVCIGSSKIEDLAEIRRLLILEGVSPDDIGCIHTYKFDPRFIGPDGKLLKTARDEKGWEFSPAERRYASVPSTPEKEAVNKQILLVTHARLRAQRNTDRQGSIDRINLWRGITRSLLIYDESLLVSDAFSVGCREIREGLALLRVAMEEGATDPDLLGTADYIERVWASIDAERTAQAGSNAPSTLKLPLFSPELPPLRMMAALPDRGDPTDALKHLLQFGDAPFRVADCSQGGGVCRYLISVPAELKNIVVLDASYPVRELVRADKSIRSPTNFNGDVKRFDHVEIRQLKHAAGRGALTKAFNLKKREDRLICREIIEAIKGLPESERVLLFTFKPKGQVDMAKILKGDMQSAGLDPNSQRFAWATWGSETASNQWNDIENVFLVGALQRSSVDLAAALIGQRDDLTSPLERGAVSALRVSEAAHSAYQAVNRTRMRTTITGQALPAKVFLMWPDGSLKAVLDRVLPGAQWLPWEPVAVKGRAMGKIEEVAGTLSSYLERLPSGSLRVSTMAIKRALPDLSALPRRTFSEAACRVDTPGWQLEGRSFVRR